MNISFGSAIVPAIPPLETEMSIVTKSVTNYIEWIQLN